MISGQPRIILTRLDHVDKLWQIKVVDPDGRPNVWGYIQRLVPVGMAVNIDKQFIFPDDDDQFFACGRAVVADEDEAISYAVRRAAEAFDCGA